MDALDVSDALLAFAEEIHVAALENFAMDSDPKKGSMPVLVVRRHIHVPDLGGNAGQLACWVRCVWLYLSPLALVLEESHHLMVQLASLVSSSWARQLWQCLRLVGTSLVVSLDLRRQHPTLM